MKLIALQYGKIEIYESMVFKDGSEDVRIPVALLFFLIEHEDKKILIDTGCNNMKSFPVLEITPAVNVLEQYGVSREQITDVILTHTHGDHIGGVKYYENANVYVNEYEYQQAALKVSEHKLFSFKEELAYNADILVKHIGGHSKGSSVVILNHSNKKYVVSGDECYTRENLLKKIPTGSGCDLEKSIYFVNEFSKPEYETIISHEDIVGKIGHKIIFE